MKRLVAMDRPLSRAEAAAAFGVHADTIVRWVREGKLPCFLTPGGQRRYRAADVADLLNKRTKRRQP